jgi:cytochrome c oxidase subunit 6a
MLSQRLISRLSQRAGRQLRSPARSPAGSPASLVQRRFGSTQGDKLLKELPDNAFNRERAAVKDHAAATSGEYPDA